MLPFFENTIQSESYQKLSFFSWRSSSLTYRYLNVENTQNTLFLTEHFLVRVTNLWLTDSLSCIRNSKYAINVQKKIWSLVSSLTRLETQRTRIEIHKDGLITYFCHESFNHSKTLLLGTLNHPRYQIWTFSWAANSIIVGILQQI